MGELKEDGCYYLAEGDTFVSIAADPAINETDGGKRLWDANKDRFPDVFLNPMASVGIRIQFVKSPQNQSARSGQVNQFQVPASPADLYLMILDNNGDPLVGKFRKHGWSFALLAGNKIYSDTLKFDSDGGVLIPGIDPSLKTAELQIVKADSPHREEKITLHIGGLWPIVQRRNIMQDYSRRKAVKKILTNQGYYQGPIDIDLTQDETRAALRTFQKEYELTVHGYATRETCQKLVDVQKNRLPAAVEIEPAPQGDRRAVLAAQGAEAPWRSNLLTKNRAFSPFGKNKTGYDSGNFHTNYVEPTLGTWVGDDVFQSAQSKDRTGLAQRMPLFPPNAYVAPCYPGQKADNPNVIMMRSRRFIFLDIGRWLQTGRDFGLIWGSHVYLCEYHGTGDFNVQPATYNGGADRLDQCFFTAFGASVTIKQYASAYWAPDSDFDWDKLYLFLPDLHLITGDKQKIWWLNYQKLQPEVDLLEFAKKLTALDATVKSHLTIMQTGDSYDLMIGLGLGEDGTDPLFEVNTDEKVKLLGDDQQYDGKTPVELLTTWIREIQGLGWVDLVYSGERKEKPPMLDQFDSTNPDIPGMNPAERAFRVLNREFGCDSSNGHNNNARMIYLYGNHDNYLILPKVCTAAQIPLRRPFYQGKGLFVEHGHRMEATFGEPGQYHPVAHSKKLGGDPRNHDGVDGGFKTACAAFVSKQRGGFGKWKIKKGQPMATAFALAHDQTHYIREAANIWLGREAAADNGLPPPHIYVIGHTHNPNMFYIDVDDKDMAMAEDED